MGSESVGGLLRFFGRFSDPSFWSSEYIGQHGSDGVNYGAAIALGISFFFGDRSEKDKFVRNLGQHINCLRV